ncbi:MAG TPA: hypothetical protein VFW33_22835 [Gemmataceae bacterium]|nr:hypothetical protein [Gemmataceae bacterium]
MMTLEDAWRWYESTRLLGRRMERLARHYWDELPWAGRLERDDHFRDLEQVRVAEEADFALAYLDDLAVVVLFSVFESLVRHHILAELREESKAIRHQALRAAAAEAREKVEEGSFFHVLEPFKGRYADLVEQVNQVRRYRNWVAHGRGGREPDNVLPREAYRRLRQFLSVIAQAPPAVAPPGSAGQGAPP